MMPLTGFWKSTGKKSTLEMVYFYVNSILLSYKKVFNVLRHIKVSLVQLCKNHNQFMQQKKRILLNYNLHFLNKYVTNIYWLDEIFTGWMKI